MKAKHARRMDFDALLFELDREQHAGYLKAARSRSERDMIAASISILDDLSPYRRRQVRPSRSLRAFAVILIAMLAFGAAVAAYRAVSLSNAVPSTWTIKN